MASLTVTIKADDQFSAALTNLADKLDRLDKHEAPQDVSMLGTVAAVALAASQSPRVVSRRSLLGLGWARRRG